MEVSCQHSGDELVTRAVTNVTAGVPIVTARVTFVTARVTNRLPQVKILNFPETTTIFLWKNGGSQAIRVIFYKGIRTG